MKIPQRRRLAAGILAGLLAVLGIGAAAPAQPPPSELFRAGAPANGPDSGAPEPARAFSLPVDGEVLRPFDPPDQPWLAGHRGVDLTSEVGAPVQAAGAGTVAFAGVVVDRPLVSIDHPIGVRTTYEPVDPAVKRGDAVSGGQVIGALHTGNGHCRAPCLHWGARIGAQTYIDPLALLRPPVIRLYPPEPW